MIFDFRAFHVLGPKNTCPLHCRRPFASPPTRYHPYPPLDPLVVRWPAREVTTLSSHKCVCDYFSPRLRRRQSGPFPFGPSLLFLFCRPYIWRLIRAYTCVAAMNGIVYMVQEMVVRVRVETLILNPKPSAKRGNIITLLISL